MTQHLSELKNQIKGDCFTDDLHKIIYATDASVYKKTPLAVVIPKDENDLVELIKFANKHKVSLTPRTAGTSLAGQCVTDGIVVDTSKHFNQIISLDTKNKTVVVQPGIIRDQLNQFLKSHGLFFAPNTSTSNRCMIGGMVGNNSSGTTSIQFGVTRDKVTKLKTVLSNGEVCEFEKISNNEFIEKGKSDSLEGKIYQSIHKLLESKETQQNIHESFPKEGIHRRNTGYALDALLKSKLFGGVNDTINLCELLTGSEGTLAFTTEITLQLDDLPPAKNIMVAAHFSSIEESMLAVVTTMKHNLYMCELMDKIILDCTKNNREQLKNRFFVEGDPKAILMLELCAETIEEARILAQNLITDLKSNDLGYAYPILEGDDIKKAITLRQAGLGLLGNIVGDDKAVACIEDTAVSLEDLPNYINDFAQMMEDYNQDPVYYAHAGAGEIHLRPILNLKKKADVKLFREITHRTAELVKKYNGSFSGEHGDGIVRAEFIPLMIGQKNYEILKEIKKSFDPNNILNRGKIIDSYKMDESLRYASNHTERAIETTYDFSDSMGIIRAAEKCNGSGDCRKLPSSGGTLCPSYRATRDEKDSTRARANTLREILTNSEQTNPFNSSDLKEVLDLCLSCKACSSECPSNVDIATMKSEFLHQYYKSNKRPISDYAFGLNNNLNKIASKTASVTNRLINTKFSKGILGIHPKRSVPTFSKTTTINWYQKNYNPKNRKKQVYLFIDEFTNYYDAPIGIEAIQLLDRIGIDVLFVSHEASGRAMASKGFLNELKQVANKNIVIFKDIINKSTPLIGIEPSAILTFRDEYPKIADDQESAKRIAQNTFTFDEFISQLIKEGFIDSSLFSEDEKNVKIHGHCHQKSLGNSASILEMLNIPKNYSVSIMNTGCCGMAGSFGYEKDKYEISMQVGEDSLFPKVRNSKNSTLIAASGTSCRHQIFDGTNKSAKHPISILYNALK